MLEFLFTFVCGVLVSLFFSFPLLVLLLFYKLELQGGKNER